MSESITMKSSLGIYPYLMLILGVNGISAENTYCTSSGNQLYEILTPQVDTPKFNFGTTTVTLQTSTSIVDDSEVLCNFVSSIVKEMKPLDTDIAEFVSENFWDLL